MCGKSKEDGCVLIKDSNFLLKLTIGMIVTPATDTRPEEKVIGFNSLSGEEMGSIELLPGSKQCVEYLYAEYIGGEYKYFRFSADCGDSDEFYNGPLNIWMDGKLIYEYRFVGDDFAIPFTEEDVGKTVCISLVGGTWT